MVDTLEQWFIREIVPHEAALMRHLARVSFLFAAARNLIVDRVRRERVVHIEARGELDALNV